MFEEAIETSSEEESLDRGEDITIGQLANDGLGKEKGGTPEEIWDPTSRRSSPDPDVADETPVVDNGMRDFSNEVEAGHGVVTDSANASRLDAIAFYAVMAAPALLLRRPHHKSTTKENIACLERRLETWRSGDIMSLLDEGQAIQKYILYSKKFSSAKKFVKSDRRAVRQEFIFVKRRSSLVALRSFGRCFVAYRLSSHS